jgi:hypothetical protein
LPPAFAAFLATLDFFAVFPAFLDDLAMTAPHRCQDQSRIADEEVAIFFF